MTATKRVYEPVAESLRFVYDQAVEMYANGEKESAEVLYRAVTGIVGEVKSAFYRDNIHFDGQKFQDAVYGNPAVYGVWHGGASYSSGGDFMDNLEVWSDLDGAKESLRYREGGRDSFTYVHESGAIDISRSGWFDTPATDRDSYIDLYHTTYSGLELIIADEPYKRLFFGPRMGVREESF